MSLSLNKSLRLNWLIAFPFIVYAISYCYLAIYHGRWSILNTVIHEGGTFTLWQTILYASHFLGHIPVHTVLAFYFVGVYCCMSPSAIHHQEGKKWTTLFIGLILFVLFTGFLSGVLFGTEDTLGFLFQQKQSVIRYEQGGSWNLHLPSTMTQFLLIPIFIFLVKLMIGSSVSFHSGGRTQILIAALLFVVMSVVLNDHLGKSLRLVWSNPRYLGHSVRELLTFPFTYYPIPLFFMLKWEFQSNSHIALSKNIVAVMTVSMIVFIFLFLYQIYVPLTHDLAALAQQPAFAKNGELSIAYLLSSHYFEHFLDTIYFSLLCLTLYCAGGRRRD